MRALSKYIMRTALANFFLYAKLAQVAVALTVTQIPPLRNKSVFFFMFIHGDTVGVFRKN